MSTKLYEDSLKLTINKNLQDIRILLQWAEEAYETREKIQHAEQALNFLQEVVETLRELHNHPSAPTRDGPNRGTPWPSVGDGDD